MYYFLLKLVLSYEVLSLYIFFIFNIEWFQYTAKHRHIRHKCPLQKSCWTSGFALGSLSFRSIRSNERFEQVIPYVQYLSLLHYGNFLQFNKKYKFLGKLRVKFHRCVHLDTKHETQMHISHSVKLGQSLSRAYSTINAVNVILGSGHSRPLRGGGTSEKFWVIIFGVMVNTA